MAKTDQWQQQSDVHIPSTDDPQFMTLKMTSAQVVETSVIVNNSSSFQNYTYPDDHTQKTTNNKL